MFPMSNIPHLDFRMINHPKPFTTACSMEGKRQKITNRPQRSSPSKITLESRDVQEQQYESYWQQKREAYEEKERKMLTRLHGTGEAKV